MFRSAGKSRPRCLPGFINPDLEMPGGVSWRSLDGAAVSVYQAQPSLIINCTPTLTAHETGWAAPLFSTIVGVWIDVSGATANLNDVWFDDIVYGE